MIKCFIAVLLFILPVPADLKKLRELYPRMSTQESALEEIRSLCEKSKSLSPPLKMAYSAAAEMASAHYKFSPVSKLSAFNRGKKILDAAVSSDTANVEVRYIRFTIQNNAPSFLGYTKNIGADKNFLLRHLKPLKTNDPDLYATVYAFLLTHGKLEESQLQLLK